MFSTGEYKNVLKYDKNVIIMSYAMYSINFENSILALDHFHFSVNEKNVY